MEIYTNIVKYAKSRGLSISTMEKELGFSAGQMAKWNKNIPSIDKVVKVANYLDMSIDDIYGRRTFEGHALSLTPELITLINMYNRLPPEYRGMLFHMAEMLTSTFDSTSTDNLSPFGVGDALLKGGTRYADKKNGIGQSFNNLNEEGREKVIEYINDLNDSGRYQEKNNQSEMVEKKA